ncbi:MAG: hypothetical protein JWP34_1063 [Massilia sp.]|nr:hypothetical protein [Massilia sp.]
MNSAQTDRNTLSPSFLDLTTLAAAQRDMRSAYLGGAPGVLVSGLVWAVAGCVATWISPERAVWALFVGGIFIHPVAVLCTRLLGRSGRHTPGNPLGALAMATTFWMIMMLPLAYGVSLLRIDLFFPAMLLVIGGRYLCFQTVFGTRLYWVFGAVLALAGYGLAELNAPVALGGFAGAVIEAVFACLLLAGARREAGIRAASA